LLKDLTRIIIVCRKINPAHLEEEGFESIKLQYYLYKFHYNREMMEFNECSQALVKVFQALNSKNYKGEVDKVITKDFSMYLDKRNLSESLLTYKCLEKFHLKK